MIIAGISPVFQAVQFQYKEFTNSYCRTFSELPSYLTKHWCFNTICVKAKVSNYRSVWVISGNHTYKSNNTMEKLSV